MKFLKAITPLILVKIAFTLKYLSLLYMNYQSLGILQNNVDLLIIFDLGDKNYAKIAM